jgi:hypothetical protein
MRGEVLQSLKNYASAVERVAVRIGFMRRDVSDLGRDDRPGAAEA